MAPSPSALRPGSEDGEPTPTRGYSKRGDGFSVQETEGLVHEVSERWQEGWDVVADVHNAQFPGHKRTAGSLKRKFAKLYRLKIDASTKEKHVRAALLAKKVREEMRGQRRALPGTARVLGDELESDGVEVHEDLNEVMMTQSAAQNQTLTDATVANEHDLRLTQTVVMQETPLREDAWQAAISRWPVAGEPLRRLRAQIESGATASTQELMQTVLLVLLESQHQRELERDQDREERRLEKQRWLEEMREQRRRHEQERAEDRRRNDHFMQTVNTLITQLVSGQRSGLN
ncbi:hypothetical protein PHMEG_0001164 [Phytophthora megakarya]|uniref:Uncharacterized protein n=1 Tax=Phytophthora megakarya TaxID=4795 RepID=A0A225X1U0_9STRA|nr:hypothetical protein PHMEG_0001164 [Phytophthora megakarya]